MKAIVVRQPWATLIALGVKTIETRPAPPNGPMRPDGVRGLPGCTLERGERIAIVAGAQKPERRHEVHWGTRDDPTDPLIEANEAPWLWTAVAGDPDAPHPHQRVEARSLPVVGLGRASSRGGNRLQWERLPREPPTAPDRQVDPHVTPAHEP